MTVYANILYPVVSVFSLMMVGDNNSM